MTDLIDPDRNDIVNQAELALMRGMIDRRAFLRVAAAAGVAGLTAQGMAAHALEVRDQQSWNGRHLRKSYDFIVCGAGSSGCALARRLADNPEVQVLLIEAGGTDLRPEVTDGTVWFDNIGGPMLWNFTGQPTPTLNNRTPAFPMGKVLGGGSSVNGLVWARGHKNDYDGWAAEVGDDAWNYESVLAIYRRIEDWSGVPNPRLRGVGGPVKVSPPEAPNSPLAPAMAEAARLFGMPVVDDPNAEAMEGEGGAGMPNVIVRDGRRVSMAAAYLHPVMNRPNLTVLLETEVRGLLRKGRRITGVELLRQGRTIRIGADREVVLSTGAINTPKLLMLAGIGPEADLRRIGVPIVQKMDGVGQNFQDHVLLCSAMWESPVPIARYNNSAEFTFFWKSDPSLKTPDLQPFMEEFPNTSEVTRRQYQIPPNAWSFAPGLVRPTSRGHLTLASADRDADPLIYPNLLATDQDMQAMRRAIEICREMGNSAPLRPFVKREVMPGPIKGAELDDFIRNAAGTYWHQTGTCRMGHDTMSVVDPSLRVHGVDGLRVIDGSIMPSITTGNTMAGCVIIGERGAEEIKKTYAI
jgi:choline dehydrogenase